MMIGKFVWNMIKKESNVVTMFIPADTTKEQVKQYIMNHIKYDLSTDDPMFDRVPIYNELLKHISCKMVYAGKFDSHYVVVATGGIYYNPAVEDVQLPKHLDITHIIHSWDYCPNFNSLKEYLGVDD